jgi:1,2-diacylglycerol 3-alpha-glucosyltransferase
LREVIRAPRATALVDVVHVHTPFRAHTLGVRIARACNAPVVETYHTYFEEYVAHYLPWCPSDVARFLARRMSRKLCGEVDHLIVPTEEMETVLRGYGIARPPPCCRPASTSTSSGAAIARLPRAHTVVGRAPVVATVSRLAIEKNIAVPARGRAAPRAAKPPRCAS